MNPESDDSSGLMKRVGIQDIIVRVPTKELPRTDQDFWRLDYTCGSWQSWADSVELSDHGRNFRAKNIRAATVMPYSLACAGEQSHDNTIKKSSSMAPMVAPTPEK